MTWLEVQARTQVLRESLRMFPVAATGLSRCTDEDCVLGDYHIPAGTEIQVGLCTLILLSQYVQHRLEPLMWVIA